MNKEVKVKEPTPQSDMLFFCLGIVSGSEECSLEKAFIKLLDYTALKLSIDTSVVVSLKQKTFDLLKEEFNLELLRQEPRDWFGELYESLVSNGITIPDGKECTYSLRDYADAFPKAVLFKKFNTGRDAIEIFKKYGDTLLYYGIQSDMLLYRIALVNMFLFDIPAFVVCLDEEIAKDKNFELSSPNWVYSNFWIPPKDKLFT